jgi:hypothetical protein
VRKYAYEKTAAAFRTYAMKHGAKVDGALQFSLHGVKCSIVFGASFFDTSAAVRIRVKAMVLQKTSYLLATRADVAKVFAKVDARCEKVAAAVAEHDAKCAAHEAKWQESKRADERLRRKLAKHLRGVTVWRGEAKYDAAKLLERLAARGN